MARLPMNTTAAASTGVPAQSVSVRPVARDMILFAFCFALVSVPVLLTDTLPLRDLQNHLARMPILAADGAGAFYAEYYRVDWHPISALGIDLIMPRLLGMFGLAWTAKIFVLMLMAAISSGTIALNRLLFRDGGAWPFLSFLFLYNGILIWGFVGYLLGIGLSLWALFLWFLSPRWPAWPRIALFSLIGCLLLLAHLYSFCLYGLCVACAELRAHWLERRDFKPWTNRELWVAAAQFVLPVFLFLVLSPTSGTFAQTGLFSLTLKLHGLATLVQSYDFWVDLTVSLLICVAMAAAVARGVVVIAPKMIWGVAALCLAFVIMPDVIFHSGFANFRLPVAICFVVIAASSPAVARASPRWGVAAIVTALVLQNGFVAAKWAQFQPRYDDIAQLTAQVPGGKRLLVVVAQDDKLYGLNTPPIAYAPLLMTAQRQIFTNGMFIRPLDASTLFLTPKYRWLENDAAWFPEYYPDDRAIVNADPFNSAKSPFRPRFVEFFDYLLIYREAAFDVSLATMFRKVDSRENLSLYALH
jgi:hypothetical protein